MENRQSSESELSTRVRNFVVITSIGDYWIESDKAQKIIKATTENKKAPNGYVSIPDVGFVALAKVQAVLTKNGYEVYQKKKRGEWQCERGGWHTRFEPCDCPLDIRAYYAKMGRKGNNPQSEKEASK